MIDERLTQLREKRTLLLDQVGNAEDETRALIDAELDGLDEEINTLEYYQDKFSDD